MNQIKKMKDNPIETENVNPELFPIVVINKSTPNSYLKMRNKWNT